MGFSFNGLTKKITLTSGTTTFSTNAIYSRWKDWVLAGNAKWLPAFTGLGGEPIGGGLTAGFYLFLTNGWSIIPDDVDHTLTVQGNLVRSPDDLSGEPIFQPVSSDVLIIQQSSVVAIGYSTGGGTSLTAADVWSYGGGRSLTTTPPGSASQLSLDALAAQVAAILTDTNQLQRLATADEQIRPTRYKKLDPDTGEVLLDKIVADDGNGTIDVEDAP